MTNAIVLHGKPGREEYYDPQAPSPSNAHWIPWLQAQLLKNDIWTATPEVPRAFEPDWQLWCREVERFDITPATVVVGHSCGAGFWLRWLSEHSNVRVAKVVLVAPWLGNGDADQFFADFTIDPQLTERAEVILFNSDDDGNEIQQAVSNIRMVLPNISYRELHHYGHFTSGSMNSVEFPELLAVCLPE